MDHTKVNKVNVYRQSKFGTPILAARGLPVFVAKKEASILNGWAVDRNNVYDYSGLHPNLEDPICDKCAGDMHGLMVGDELAMCCDACGAVEVAL